MLEKFVGQSKISEEAVRSVESLNEDRISEIRMVI